MSKTIEFYHGALCDSYEKQANEQGFTFGAEAEFFQEISYAYNMLYIHGYITDSQADAICKKIQKSLIKSLKKLPELPMEEKNDD